MKLIHTKNSFYNRILILLGNVLDHYDTALYSLLAPLFAHLIFPKSDPIVALILAYGLLSTSLFTRPLGAIFFSYLARKVGPQKSMACTLMGIGITTGCLGLLPTYEKWGWYSPASIALIRFFQGLFASGENTIVPIHLLHQYPDQHHGRANSLYQSTTIIGILLASGLSMCVSFFPAILEAWRWPFLLGGITALMGVLFRYMQFDKLNDVYKEKPVFHNLLSHKDILLGIVLISGLSYVTYAIPFVFFNAFIPFITTITYHEMLKVNTALLVFDLMLIPFIGFFVDRFKADRVMKISAFILLASILPLFYGLPESNYLYVSFVRMWIIVLGLFFCVPMTGVLIRLLPFGSQYTLIGLGYAIGSEILGRNTTTICLWLWHKTHWVIAPGLYVCLTILCALGGLGLLLRSEKDRNNT